MTSARGTSRVRHKVPTVPRVGCRRPLSRSRSVFGSMAAASVSCARVHPRRIRSRSTMSARTCHPTSAATLEAPVTSAPLPPDGRRAECNECATVARGGVAAERIDGDFVGNFIPSTPRSGTRIRHKRVQSVVPFRQLHDVLVPACVNGVRTALARRDGAEISARGALFISSWLPPDIDTHSGTSPVGVRSSGP